MVVLDVREVSLLFHSSSTLPTPQELLEAVHHDAYFQAGLLHGHERERTGEPADVLQAQNAKHGVDQRLQLSGGRVPELI